MSQRDINLVWAETGGVQNPGAVKYVDGWEAEIPSFQNFNYVLQNSTLNHQALAQDGVFTWESDVVYMQGTAVRGSDGKLYNSRRDNNLSIDPVGDTSRVNWTHGLYIGNGTILPASNIGLHIDDPLSTNADRTQWNYTDVHVSSGMPKLVLSNTAGVGNVMLVNRDGTLSVYENLTSSLPDGTLINTPARIFSEAHPPIQTEVAGTIPDTPNDGRSYARKFGNWIPTSATTVQPEPPPTSTGSGNLWYNLDDGRTYVDINDGDTSQWVDMSPPSFPDYTFALDPTVIFATGDMIEAGIHDHAIVTPSTLSTLRLGGMLVRGSDSGSTESYPENPLDMDTMINSGVYPYTDSHANTPTASENGVVFIMVDGTVGRVYQMAMNINGGVSTRTSVDDGATWVSWTQL